MGVVAHRDGAAVGPRTDPLGTDNLWATVSIIFYRYDSIALRNRSREALQRMDVKIPLRHPYKLCS